MPHQCTNCGHTFADGSKEMLSGCPECGGNKFQFFPPGADVEESDGRTDAAPPERPGEGGVSGAVGKAAATVRDLVSEGAPATESTDAEALEDGVETAETADSVGTDSTARPPEAESAADVDEPTGTDEPIETDEPTGTDEPTSSSSPPGSAPASSDARGAVSGDEDELGSEEDSEDAAQASARSEMVSSSDLPERPPSEGRVVKEPDADASTDEPDMEALRAELNDQFESIRVLAPGQYELNLMELYDRPEYIIALQENGRYVIEVPDTFVDADRPGDADE